MLRRGFSVCYFPVVPIAGAGIPGIACVVVVVRRGRWGRSSGAGGVLVMGLFPSRLRVRVMGVSGVGGFDRRVDDDIAGLLEGQRHLKAPADFEVFLDVEQQHIGAARREGGGLLGRDRDALRRPFLPGVGVKLDLAEFFRLDADQPIAGLAAIVNEGIEICLVVAVERRAHPRVLDNQLAEFILMGPGRARG